MESGEMTDDMDGKRTERMEIYVSPELELELRKLAERDDRKVSHYVCRALIEHVYMMRERARMAQSISQPRTTSLRPVHPFDEDAGEKCA